MSDPAPDAAQFTGTESVEALTGHQVAQPLVETCWTPSLAREAKRAPLRALRVRTEGEPSDPEWLREVEQHVTQIVAGEPMRRRWQELGRGSFVHKLIRKASAIDIHVIARR